MAGNKHDSTAFDNNIKYFLIDNSKHKKFILADSAYDTKYIKETASKLNYTPIIDYNKRNTKNDSKKRKFNPKEKKIYKTRIKIENFFCRLKKYKRILFRQDSYEDSYMGFVYMAALDILVNKIYA